jgi:hypothetical protein
VLAAVDVRAARVINRAIEFRARSQLGSVDGLRAGDEQAERDPSGPATRFRTDRPHVAVNSFDYP